MIASPRRVVAFTGACANGRFADPWSNERRGADRRRPHRRLPAHAAAEAAPARPDGEGPLQVPLRQPAPVRPRGDGLCDPRHRADRRAETVLPAALAGGGAALPRLLPGWLAVRAAGDRDL